MKTEPIVPARPRLDPDGVPRSAEYGDIYHPRIGALAQARHVFLGGNGLPGRWQGRERFVVLETGFGLGHNFLATWDAWQRDPARCGRLVFVSIEKHPLAAADLARLHAASELPALSQALCAAWPALTPNLHRLGFDGGRVELLLALGDARAWLRELVATVDAFFLDGFAPALNPAMWDEHALRSLARLAAPGATAATWTAAGAVRQGLRRAGFTVETAAGIGGKRDITRARHAPVHVAQPPAGRRIGLPEGRRSLIVVGAGLAGCAVAAALADAGCEPTLIDREAGPARAASGNPAGLFHGVVHAPDGLHARFLRACALEAGGEVRRLLAAAPAADGAPDRAPLGAADGLLRLETGLPLPAMQARLASLGLPPDHVQALSAEEASVRAGVALAHPAWHFPTGGWVRPAELAQAWRSRAGPRSRWLGSRAVAAVRQDGTRWQALSADGDVLAEADGLVLANAEGAWPLLRSLGGPVPEGSSEPVRGQITALPLAALPADTGSALPRLPIAGAGYVLPPVDGQLLFGATSQPDDADPDVRPADHAANLARLAELLPGWREALGRLPVSALQGRTAWRSVAADRLPIVGAVPACWVGGEAGTWDQPRFVPRVPGLYLCTAFGSRGITVAALCARVLAAQVTGAPVPLEADLMEAIDPARFVARATRREASSLARA
jgi:tRNA 5-methylaminomethyl-2-thiouridine biosynthesis bifunctional protein